MVYRWSFRPLVLFKSCGEPTQELLSKPNLKFILKPMGNKQKTLHVPHPHLGLAYNLKFCIPRGAGVFLLHISSNSMADVLALSLPLVILPQWSLGFPGTCVPSHDLVVSHD